MVYIRLSCTVVCVFVSVVHFIEHVWEKVNIHNYVMALPAVLHVLVLAGDVTISSERTCAFENKHDCVCVVFSLCCLGALI